MSKKINHDARRSGNKSNDSARGLLFCGDPHGRFEHILAAAQAWPDAPIILLGDLQPPAPLPDLLGPIWERTWFIHGNHDTDSAQCAEHVWSEAAQVRSLHARATEIRPGLAVAGLGGVFRERVWHPDPGSAGRGQPLFASRELHALRTPPRDRWRDGVPLCHWSSIYPEDMLALQSLRCDVLVLHEAPGYHPHGAPLFDELARTMHARLVVHGHHHDAIDSSERWEDQGFRSFGVGLRGITWIDPETAHFVIVRPGERDAQRLRRN